MSFDQPSPSTASPQPSSAAAVNGSSSRRRKGLPVHRCRFPDWSPAGVSALAITPESFDAGVLGFGANSGERGVLAIGRANGDVELMLWGGHQGWMSWRVRPAQLLPWIVELTTVSSTDSPFVFPSSQAAQLAQADFSPFSPRLDTPDDAFIERPGLVRGRRRRRRAGDSQVEA